MEVKNFLACNVIRLFQDETSNDPKKFYIGDIASAIKEKYRFLEGPTKLDDFNLKTGVSFVHGLYGNGNVIGKLSIFNNGVFCEAQQPTELISEFIEDVFKWARKDIGMEIGTGGDVSVLFTSKVEIQTDAPFAEALEKFAAIGEKLTALVSSYGQETMSFLPVSLAFHCDPTKAPLAPPTMFTFERRHNRPFEENVFFSSAPLKSADHLNILMEMEEILRH